MYASVSELKEGGNLTNPSQNTRDDNSSAPFSGETVDYSDVPRVCVSPAFHRSAHLKHEAKRGGRVPRELVLCIKQHKHHPARGTMYSLID